MMQTISRNVIWLLSQVRHFSPAHGMELFNDAGQGCLLVKMTHQMTRK